MSDPSATAVRPGAALTLSPVDAADAQDAAGLLLFPRADQLVLVGHDTRLADGLAPLKPGRWLGAGRSGRADRLGVVRHCRPPPAPGASRRRRTGSFGLTVGSRKPELRLFENRRPGRNCDSDFKRRVDHQIQ